MLLTLHALNTRSEAEGPETIIMGPLAQGRLRRGGVEANASTLG